MQINSKGFVLSSFITWACHEFEENILFCILIMCVIGKNLFLAYISLEAALRVRVHHWARHGSHHNIDSLIFLFHTRLKVAWYPFLHSLGGESNCPQSVAKYRLRLKMSSICPNILGNYLPLRGNT